MVPDRQGSAAHEIPNDRFTPYLQEIFLYIENEILELKMKISEIGIKWEEIEGTKMVPVLSWIQMARDLVMIWCRYTIRYWTVSSK